MLSAYWGPTPTSYMISIHLSKIIPAAGALGSQPVTMSTPLGALPPITLTPFLEGCEGVYGLPLVAAGRYLTTNARASTYLPNLPR